MDHADLGRLWQLADTIPRSEGRAREGAFEPIGLILQRPPSRATYASTPGNTLALARTGGDGVHFSFVLRDGAIHADSPILMSVPMAFHRPNVIVGRDLREFLALGVGSGFFALERIVYEPDAFFGEYPMAGEPPEQIRLIRSEFGVEPWAEPRARLDELRVLEHLLEAPAPPPPETPMLSAVAFWEAQLAFERARPEDERDVEREAHIEGRLAEVRNHQP